jgi:hypothetical protein
MRSRGTRIDDLKVEPIGENRPGYYRIIRFGNFSKCEGSEEMIINRKELESFAKQCYDLLKDGDKNGKTEKSI